MPSPVLYMLAQKARVPKSKAEEFWEKAKVLAKKKGLKDGTTEFYAYVTGILKRMLKIEGLDLETDQANKIVERYLFDD